MTVFIRPFNEKYISVSFPDNFNATMLNAVNSVPERKWNNEEKSWLVPFNQKSVDILLENIYETKLFNFEDEPSSNIKEENKEKKLGFQLSFLAKKSQKS